MQNNNQEVTVLLNSWRDGNEAAMDKLMGVVYQQLKLMAHRYTIKERAENTLNTTGLVHEAYLKLLGQNNRDYQNRSHFYAILSTCMRRVILEVARSKTAQKRGSNSHKVDMEDHFLVAEKDADQIISVNDALNKLSEFDERLAQIVEYRYFAGMKLQEIAELMDVSLSTIKRDWRLAKSYLVSELKET